MNLQLGLDFLSKIIQFDLWIFLVGVMSSVFFLAIKKRINIRGLLPKQTGNLVYNPQQIQVLILTLVFMGLYLVEVRHSLNSCTKVPGIQCSLPMVRNEYLAILGGSNLVYLWGKLSSILRERKS